MTLAQLGTFALASVVIVAVPGPSAMFIVGQAFARGRRTAAVTVFGNAVGAYLQVVLVAFGIGLLVERSLTVFEVVKLLGAAYLVCIGVRAFLRRDSLQKDLVARTALDTSTAFRQGLLVGASNPKTIVFFTALLPSFVVRSAGAVPAQLLVLGLVYVVVALTGDCGWGLAAGSVREWFGRSPRRLRMVGGAGGLAIIGVGISLAVSSRKD